MTDAIPGEPHRDRCIDCGKGRPARPKKNPALAATISLLPWRCKACMPADRGKAMRAFDQMLAATRRGKR